MSVLAGSAALVLASLSNQCWRTALLKAAVDDRTVCASHNPFSYRPFFCFYSTMQSPNNNTVPPGKSHALSKMCKIENHFVSRTVLLLPFLNVLFAFIKPDLAPDGDGLITVFH